MQQAGDYSTSYYPPPPPPHQYQNHNHNPNPTDIPSSYASAPPFSNYSSTDYPQFSSSYPPYPQTADPIPPTAPSYGQTPPNHQPYSLSSQPSQFPSFQPPQNDTQTAPYLPPPPPVAAPTTQSPSVPYYPYEPQLPASNYTAPLNPSPNPVPNLNPDPNPPYSSPNSASSYPHLVPSVPPVYQNPNENIMKFDYPTGYLDENSGRYGGYGRSNSSFEHDLYEKKTENPVHLYDGVGPGMDSIDEGVYAYDGGKVEPYGARGTSSKSSTWSAFDDYGRSTTFSSGKEQMESGKIVKAVPKVEVRQDVKDGVQKFRVKLLPEGPGQGTMDVLCQIGLDGIRMLDPSTNRTLRIYPLETVTKWEAESSIYTFWAKSSVDIEPRRIRLQSNSYTTNTILDTVTAATVQLKEMGGKDGFVRSGATSDDGKLSEQLTEKKKGFADWMNLIKPGNVEKDHWVPDEAVNKCTACGTDFGSFVRKHHCRNCGDIFCDKCTHGRIALTADEQAQPVRVCDRCLAEVSQRLSNAKEASSRSAVLHSHEDLARKLQEEMDRKRKATSGSNSSDASGRRMREVACPTCTVHLQVQVPASGSETIECGVCQHPFLVSAH